MSVIFDLLDKILKLVEANGWLSPKTPAETRAASLQATQKERTDEEKSGRPTKDFWQNRGL